MKLKAGKHHSCHLQRAWDRDGEDVFVFELLEECERLDLVDREQYWIDVYHAADDRFGYNIAPKAYSKLGVRASIDTKKRMSENRRGSQNANALLDEDQVVRIKELLAEHKTIVSVADEFGVSYFVIWDIAVGHRWQHVHVDGFTPKKMGPPLGEANGSAKLTAAEVGRIKTRLVSGESWIQIANSLGVDRRVIHDILTGKKWGSVVVDGFIPKQPSNQKGSKHPHAKLTEDDVRSMRQESAEGMTGVALAEKYNITRSTVSRILNRRGWPHV